MRPTDFTTIPCARLCQPFSSARGVLAKIAAVPWHATTPELRALFRAIAHDEAQHAELAFRVRDWLLPQLRQHQRCRLDDAHRVAISALAEELSAEPPTVWQDVAGLPDAITARRLLALLAVRLPVGAAA